MADGGRLDGIFTKNAGVETAVPLGTDDLSAGDAGKVERGGPPLLLSKLKGRAQSRPFVLVPDFPA